MMRRLFKDAVIPARREALAKAIAALDAAGFAWNDRYIAAAEPGHSVELTLAGIAGAQFMPNFCSLGAARAGEPQKCWSLPRSPKFVGLNL